MNTDTKEEGVKGMHYPKNKAPMKKMNFKEGEKRNITNLACRHDYGDYHSCCCCVW